MIIFKLLSFIQILLMYNFNLFYCFIKFELLCYKESKLSIIDKLSLDYYKIKFGELTSGETSAKCVYWDEDTHVWSTTGGRSDAGLLNSF